jgi:hypothetical protein
LAQESFEGAQLIVTGASFSGLQGASRQELTKVHVSS